MLNQWTFWFCRQTWHESKLWRTYKHPKSNSRRISKLWSSDLTLNGHIPVESLTPVMFDGKSSSPPDPASEYIHWIWKRTVFRRYSATSGGIQNIEFLCTKVDFGHVGIVQKDKTDKKTHVLSQKTRNLLMSVTIYLCFVTDCRWHATKSSSTMFCLGHRRGRPLPTASTSMDGRFTSMVHNWLKTSILVPSVRHWKHSVILFKFGGS